MYFFRVYNFQQQLMDSGGQVCLYPVNMENIDFNKITNSIFQEVCSSVESWSGTQEILPWNYDTAHSDNHTCHLLSCQLPHKLPCHHYQLVCQTYQLMCQTYQLVWQTYQLMCQTYQLVCQTYQLMWQTYQLQGQTYLLPHTYLLLHQLCTTYIWFLGRAP